MDRLPPIPIPAAQRWREFRVRVVPVLMFLVTLALVVLVWNRHVIPTTLVGEIESTWVAITSPTAGALVNLSVTRLQQVSSNEVVGEVMTTDPKIIAASLELSKANLANLKAGGGVMLDLHRNWINYEQLRIQLLEQRQALLVARTDLEFANKEFDRITQLHTQGLVPASDLDMATRRQSNLKDTVQSKEQLITSLEKSLETLKPAASLAVGADDPIQTEIAVHDKELDLLTAQMSPVVLRAPQAGRVSVIHRQVGENVLAGEPILTLSGLDSDRIIGYVRPPIHISPRSGMTAKVITRGFKREEAQAHVLAVGSQFESITNALLRMPNSTFEIGLPVVFTRPKELNVFPGEIVDLILETQ